MSISHLATSHNLSLGHQQRGAATLIISLVMLILITFVTFYTSKSIITEQQLANNDYRARMAFEAAEAGLAAATLNLADDPDLDGDGILDGSTSTEYLFDNNDDGDRQDAGTDNNLVTVNTAFAEVTTEDLSSGAFTTIRISSIGFSDDRTAQRTIERVVVSLDPLPNSPQNPLTTKGSVVISGSATVHNQEGHSTIWSGDDVDLGSNNSTSTNVPDVADAAYPGCMDDAGTCSTLQSSNKTLVGLDVVENDSNLSNLTSDQFFENFFGSAPASYKDKHVTLETTHTAADTDLDGTNSEVIWVDGSGGSTELQGTAIGTAADPVILIIDGDLELSGNPTIYGVVFVMGNLTASGNSTVTGALVVNGATSNSSGSLDVYFNSAVLDGAGGQSNLGASAGSWSDLIGM